MFTLNTALRNARYDQTKKKKRARKRKDDAAPAQQTPGTV